MSRGGPERTAALPLYVVGLAFAVIGGGLAWSQADAFVRYEPVEAKVQGTDVERHESTTDGRTHVTYHPKVTYSYRVDGVQRRSDSVFPGAGSPGSAEGWAKSVVDQFEVGESVRAYYDPRDPYASFLVRRLSFFSYGFVLAGTLMIVLGIFYSSGVVGANNPTTESSDRSSERGSSTELEPSVAPNAQIRPTAISGAVWWASTGVVFVHYGSLAPNFGFFAGFAAIIALGIGLALLINLWRYWRLDNSLGTPTLTLEQYPIAANTEVDTEIRIPVGDDLEFDSVELAAVGLDRGDDEGRSRHLDFPLPFEPDEREAGAFVWETTIEISTQSRDDAYLDWRLALDVASRDVPDYEFHFPVEVIPGASETTDS